MNVLYVLVPLALLLSLASMAAFAWATRDGQWDDLDLISHKLITEPENENHPDEDKE